jgi:hypothetical protein
MCGWKMGRRKEEDGGIWKKKASSRRRSRRKEGGRMSSAWREEEGATVESCIDLVCVVASCAQVFMSKIFLYSS